jgi:hypothetical protein
VVTARTGGQPFPSVRPSPIVAAALVAGVIAFGLARWALLPGLGFWDTGEFQVVGPVLGTAHPTGFPAYVILGWLASIVLAPFGDPAFRMNLLSALAVGGAVAATVVLARQLTGHTLIALAAGLILAAVPIAWNIGTHADPHALHFLLVAVLLVLLVGWERRARVPELTRLLAPPRGVLRRPGDRWLLAAAIVYAVGLANHTLMLLLAPGIALYVVASAPGILRRPRFIVGVGGALLITTFALYLELPLRAGLLRAPLVYGHPETLSGFFYVAFAQQFVGALYQPFSDLGHKTIELAKLGYDQLGVVVGLVPLAFVATLWRQPRYALLTGVSFLITVWFAASYVNADISRYYLGPAVMVLSWLAILAAVAIEWLARVLGATDAEAADTPTPGTAWASGSRARPTGAAAVVLELAVGLALLTPTLQALPDRAGTAKLSDQRDASTWAHAAMAMFEPNAVVVSWWSYSTTLWYAQIIEGQRPDVWIVDDRTRLDENLGDVTDVIDAELGKRPVYLVRLTGDDLATMFLNYNVQPIDMPTEQVVYRVLGKRPI